MIGQLLDGRYRIASKLGEGGFGHTYLAHDTRIPNEPLCVVKQLRPANSDRQYLQIASRLFTSEAKILAQLGDHDRIPRLLAYFEQEGEFYLVEEFVEGRSLEIELVKGYRLSENQVIQMLEDVLHILEYIHSHGVIHRDIKPDNIIRRKSDGKLVLIDFGAIKQVQTQMYQEGQTGATVAIGTAGYMPSEQAQGKPRPSSDLYALGVIAIQGLTGLPPRDLQEDYQTGELIWQHLVSKQSGLVDAIAKMTRYHYKDRYESATEILQVLKQLTANSSPTQPFIPVATGSNDLQSTIVGISGSNTLSSKSSNTPINSSSNSSNLATPAIANTVAVSPTEVFSPRSPLPSGSPSSSSASPSRKVWWIGLWGGALAVAIAIGAVLATRNNPTNPITRSNNSSNSGNAARDTNNSNSISPSNPPVSSPAAPPSPSIPTASPSPSQPATTVSPVATKNNLDQPDTKVEPLTEEDAVELVNNFVAVKSQIFAPPFDRDLLAELTTGQAYTNRKGSVDWLEKNNAFYRYGEFTVTPAGTFGMQDGEASVTVEIFESPTLFVNGKVDQSQSQPSRGRYVCLLRFEDGQWKIADLTKVN